MMERIRTRSGQVAAILSFAFLTAIVLGLI